MHKQNIIIKSKRKKSMLTLTILLAITKYVITFIIFKANNNIYSNFFYILSNI